MNSVVEYRRALHQIPEIDSDLPKTIAFVQNILERQRCTISSPISGSICAFFDAGKPETIAFRADMDALPIAEETGLPFESQHAGKMHACGHDGHTAMALALADYVDAHLLELSRNVLILFQPAEETTGGAKRLCETKILEQRNVRQIFGLHLWPGLTAGTVWAKPGPQMARSSEVTIRITGKSVHISRAEEGNDALLAGVQLINLAMAMEKEALPPQEPRVLRFGKLISGDARNAISSRTEILGSLRSFSDDSFSLLCRRLSALCDQVAEATGCDVSLHINEGYPPVWNQEALFDSICTSLGDAAPNLLNQPVLATEDFSFYQQSVPGVFFFLGIGDTPQLHAPNFTFDDALVLPKGVEFLIKLLGPS